MRRRYTLLMSCLWIFIFVLSFAGRSLALPPLPAASGDYDLETGEPRCEKCHNGDKKYSIDYTREPSCFSCHGPGLSERYITVNKKYRDYEGKDAWKHTGTPEPELVASAAAPVPKKSMQAKKILSKKTDKWKGMVYVPEGYFTKGSNDWWPKVQPEHKKYVKGFYIDKYEVTVERYAAFVRATGHAQPRTWSNGRPPLVKAGHPVTYVSWSDANAFCRWEGKRLPSEDQWEKAARGTDGRAFPWGERFSRKKANTPQLGFGNTMPVGSFPDGVSPYGIFDMAGNAWEWVDNWFKPYPGNKHPDENYGERFKVLRGGSWYDCTYYKCGISAPSYNRIFFDPNTANNNFGFRCAADDKE